MSWHDTRVLRSGDSIVVLQQSEHKIWAPGSCGWAVPHKHWRVLRRTNDDEIVELDTHDLDVALAKWTDVTRDGSA